LRFETLDDSGAGAVDLQDLATHDLSGMVQEVPERPGLGRSQRCPVGADGDDVVVLESDDLHPPLRDGGVHFAKAEV
jgi:hypothetical protein